MRDPGAEDGDDEETPEPIPRQHASGTGNQPVNRESIKPYKKTLSLTGRVGGSQIRCMLQEINYEINSARPRSR